MADIEISTGNQFKTIRTLAGAMAADSTDPPTDSSAGVEVFNPGGYRNVALYWTATSLAGATADLELWVRDDGDWISAGIVRGVPADTLVKMPTHGASRAFILVDAVIGRTTETAMLIRATGQND